jgi:putative transcriptional regulator
LQECYEAESLVTLYGGMDEVEHDFVKQVFNNRPISVRRQLAMSKEDLSRHLGVNYATVNRRENAIVKLAKAQFEAFCSKMIKQGKLKL